MAGSVSLNSLEGVEITAIITGLHIRGFFLKVSLELVYPIDIKCCGGYTDLIIYESGVRCVRIIALQQNCWINKLIFILSPILKIMLLKITLFNLVWSNSFGILIPNNIIHELRFPILCLLKEFINYWLLFLYSRCRSYICNENCTILIHYLK